MEAVAVSRGGVAWPRIALLLLLGWWTARLVAGTTWIFIDFVNLAFHEFGHLFFSFAGSTVHYLGGTLGQLLVPAGLIGYFAIRRRQPFAAAFCLWWLGQNLVNVSVYMADARELSLPLVGGGDHDWNELFFRFGLLTEPSVARVSGLAHLSGLFVMLAGLAWGAFFVLPETARHRLSETATARWPWLEPVLQDSSTSNRAHWRPERPSLD